MAQRFGTRLPRHLSLEQVGRTLDAARNTAPSSLRNYAMVLLMARLGLRPPEVVAMQIDDIDWRSGEILVRGKGDRHDRLPLPPEVGKALADYIKLERVTIYRSLFVISRPPHRPVQRCPGSERHPGQRNSIGIIWNPALCEFVEGDVVEVIRAAKGSECGKADEVLPWCVVRFASAFTDHGASCG